MVTNSLSITLAKEVSLRRKPPNSPSNFHTSVLHIAQLVIDLHLSSHCIFERTLDKQQASYFFL